MQYFREAEYGISILKRERERREGGRERVNEGGGVLKQII